MPEVLGAVGAVAWWLFRLVATLLVGGFWLWWFISGIRNITADLLEWVRARRGGV